MFHRAAIGSVIVFWLVMTSLLIRLELNPDGSDLMTVPTSHVLRLMFTATQPSSLTIAGPDQKGVGILYIRPKILSPDRRYAFDFSGNIFIGLPSQPRQQRAIWDGDYEMDHGFNLLHFGLNVTLRVPPYHIHILLDPAKRSVRCDLGAVNGAPYGFSIPLTKEGASAALTDAGFDSGILSSLQRTMGSPTVTARRSTLKVRDETIETYLLTIHQGETVLAEMHISQLGQVLLVRSALGYTFSAEDIMR